MILSLLHYFSDTKAAFPCVNREKGAIFMAWSQKKLFSFATKCEGFNLRLESGLKKRGAKVVFVLARYDGPLDPSELIEGVKYSDRILNGTAFPAKTVCKAFEHAQMRADELGQEVRIVMEAFLKEEFGGDDDMFAIATIKPQEVFEPVNIPAPICSMCSRQATQKCLAGLKGNRHGGGAVIIEYGCDEHISVIRNHWR